MPYLAPLLRCSDLLAENCNFLLPLSFIACGNYYIRVFSPFEPNGKIPHLSLPPRGALTPVFDFQVEARRLYSSDGRTDERMSETLNAA